MHNKLLATAAAASTLGGAVAGATLLAPALAGAQDDVEPAEADETTEETARPEAGEKLSEALQGLVDDGTITADQREAVVTTLVEARPERGPRGHHGFGGGADIAELLGLEPTELREAITGGQSLADVAAEQGIDPQTLVEAIVDAAEDRVEQALESGRIDQERADEMLANAAERAEDVVSGEVEFGRRGGPGRFPGGGPDSSPGDADGDA